MPCSTKLQKGNRKGPMVELKAKVVASDIDCIATNYRGKYKVMVGKGKDTKKGGTQGY